MARRLGLCFLLGMLPLLVCVGFLLLAWSPGFFMLAAVMVLRRAGEYALIRPGREMLFTTVDVEAKYKVKNFIDTVVYRSGDAAGGWLKAGVDGLGYGAVLIALVGAFCAVLWGWLGFSLGLHAAQGE
jgi:AAA family ATP:ADP antiporter